MSIAIVTDSSCNITPELGQELGIYVLPILMIINQKTYKDGLDITIEEFYEKMSESGTIPTTSLPSIEDTINLYTQLSEEYDQIISIHVGAGLSGTYQTVKLVANEFKDTDITIYDSKSVSIPVMYQVLEAKRMVDAGKTVKEIIDRLDMMRENSIAFAAINSLDNLVKSGRVPGIVGSLAKIIKIKPLISLSQMGIKLIGRARTSRKALDKVLEFTQKTIDSADFPVRIDVAHGNIPDLAEKFKQELEEIFPNKEININVLSSVIGVHSGPDILGIVVTPDYRM